MSGFVSAVRTLTVLPVFGKDAASMTRALPWFPVVGALLGGLMVGAGLLIQLVFPGWYMLTTVLLLIVQTLITGAIHLDGTADAGDALFSMTSREKKLEIMKDSRLGTYGVLSLIFVIIVKIVLLSALVTSDHMVLLVIAIIISRTAQVELTTTMQYARKDAGTAKSFVDGAGGVHRGIAWMVCLVLLAMFGPLAIAAGVVALPIIWGLRWLYNRRVGGVTGDLLGAASELVEIAMLFWLCAWVYNEKWIEWPVAIYEVFV